MTTVDQRLSRVAVSVVAGALGFYALSEPFLRASGVTGRRAVPVLVGCAVGPALVARVLYPGVRSRLSGPARVTLARAFYFASSFAVFFGVGASVAYVAGTQFLPGVGLSTLTAVCGTLSGVGLSVVFWRD
ncbi:hypothetical protein [Halobaculum sp. MBLA0143]|uniref:hypothetical protein n=1 Tax=Halobaculum sp. MBLA0143 TaxID=3079933 RepID=UPI0035267630